MSQRVLLVGELKFFCGWNVLLFVDLAPQADRMMQIETVQLEGVGQQWVVHWKA